jgi:membrane-associated phospholipid phosphatase
VIESTKARIWFFLYCFSTVALLAASLLWQPAADVWRQIDEATFFLLNGSLTDGGLWAHFWAYMNIHLVNVFAGVFMVGLLLWYVFADRDDTIARKMAAFTIIALFVSLGIIVSKTGFQDMERFSPSLVLSPYYDLNILQIGIKTKVQSHHSFPGDHGVTTFIYSLLVVLLIKNRTVTTLAVIFALLNNLPRLFSGAHWLSDVVVGGGAITMLVLPFAIATPAFYWTEKLWQHFIFKSKLVSAIASKMKGA